MGAIDIPWINLALGSLLILIPLAALYYYKTGLGKPIIISFLRMAGQLFLAGLYLGFIFEINSFWLNSAWVIVMIAAATLTIIKRSELKYKYFIFPAATGVVAGVTFTGMFVIILVLGYESLFEARYVIPIAGMIVGNCLTGSIIGMRTFYQNLTKEYKRYKYALASGATRKEALFPFIQESLSAAFAPQVANMGAIGLIWLPGMMTGQILGGSSPMEAIKYQILIITGIAAGSMITILFGINISKRFVFDDFDMLKSGVKIFEAKQR